MLSFFKKSSKFQVSEQSPFLYFLSLFFLNTIISLSLNTFCMVLETAISIMCLKKYLLVQKTLHFYIVSSFILIRVQSGQ